MFKTKVVEKTMVMKHRNGLIMISASASQTIKTKVL